MVLKGKVTNAYMVFILQCQELTTSIAAQTMGEEAE